MPGGIDQSEQFASMSKEDYEAAAGPGRRWVYHAGERADQFAKGVRMENVPRNLARMRYEAGEHAEYAPGAGIGKGTYVSGEAWQASGYGHHMFAISVPHGSLSVPPESQGYKPEDVEFHLHKDTVGALLTHDVGPEHVVHMGRVRSSSMTGHETHQANVIRAGGEVPEHLMSPQLKEHIRYAKERGWDI